MPIPKKVRIGYGDFQVACGSGTDGDLIARSELGFSDGANLKIAVRSDVPSLTRRETLLHEVIHMCIYMAGIDVGGDEQEEKIVNGLSVQLFDTLLRNPELVEFLAGEK